MLTFVRRTHYVGGLGPLLRGKPTHSINECSWAVRFREKRIAADRLFAAIARISKVAAKGYAYLDAPANAACGAIVVIARRSPCTAPGDRPQKGPGLRCNPPVRDSWPPSETGGTLRLIGTSASIAQLREAIISRRLWEDELEPITTIQVLGHLA